jgi:hypothetical protein
MSPQSDRCVCTSFTNNSFRCYVRHDEENHHNFHSTECAVLGRELWCMGDVTLQDAATICTVEKLLAREMGNPQS